MGNEGKYVKCRMDAEGKLDCKPEEEEKAAKPKKDKCTTLIDPKTKNRVEVCTRDGKPVSVKQSAEFQPEED